MATVIGAFLVVPAGARAQEWVSPKQCEKAQASFAACMDRDTSSGQAQTGTSKSKYCTEVSGVEEYCTAKESSESGSSKGSSSAGGSSQGGASSYHNPGLTSVGSNAAPTSGGGLGGAGAGLAVLFAGGGSDAGDETCESRVRGSGDGGLSFTSFVLGAPMFSLALVSFFLATGDGAEVSVGSSALGGVGPGSPMVEIRFSGGLASDGMEGQTVPLDPAVDPIALGGRRSGLMWDYVLRFRWLRLGATFTELTGDSIDTDRVHAESQATSRFGVGAGLQFGKGLLSPYVGGEFRFLRGQGNGSSGGYEVTADDQSFDCFDLEEHELFADSTDWALRVGNTFNLSGLVRKIKPPKRGNMYLIIAPVIDAGVIIPFDSPYTLGWHVTGGISWQIVRDQP